MNDDDNMKKEIQSMDYHDNEYSLFGIGLVILFYIIMVIALFQITTFRHMYNYVTALLFLVVNMTANIRVIGFSKHYLRRIRMGFYAGMITFNVIYTAAYFITWFFIQITSMGTYIIINLLLVFLYLAASYAAYSFALRQGRN